MSRRSKKNGSQRQKGQTQKEDIRVEDDAEQKEDAGIHGKQQEKEQMEGNSDEAGTERENPGSEEVQNAEDSLRENERVRELQQGLKEELDAYRTEQQKRYRGIDTREEEAPKRKKKSKLKILLVVLVVILMLMVMAVSAFFIMRQMGKNALLSTEKSDVSFSVPEKMTDEITVGNDGIVVYNGEKYCYNTSIANILCMGIDKEQMNTEDTVASGDSGQADTLFLVSIDTETGKSTMLSISRDAMVDVNAYNSKGEYTRTRTLQLCLAYAYGDGKELSCENTIRSVSRLLYGVPISSYAAIDLKAIGVLNDAVGGVDVTVLEDLTLIDPALKAGEQVKLAGQQAEAYVRSREAYGETASADSNTSRMERQKQYLSAFATKALDATKVDITVPVTLYNAASDYMVTNVTPAKVTYLASLMLQYRFTDSNILTVPGTAKMGRKYAEYHVDEEALYKMILEIFYKKIS